MMALLALALLAPPPQTVALAAAGPVRVGAPVPWFAGWDASDQIINRSKLLKGAAPGTRAHVIVVFATWCAPCAEGLKRLALAHDRLEAAGIRVLLVAWRQDAETVQPWLAAQGIDPKTPVILDRFGRAAVAMGAEQADKATLPRTLVLAPDGTVRALFGIEGVDYIDRLVALAQP